MKATDVSEVGGTAAWLKPGVVTMQRKFDGLRATLRLFPGRARLAGPGSIANPSSFPELTRIRLPKLAGTIFDGEFVVPGYPAATAAGWFGSGPAKAMSYRLSMPRPVYYVFDLLADRGKLTTGLPYAKRRERLEKLVAKVAKRYPEAGIVLVPELPPTAEALAAELDSGAEGVVFKRLDSVYKAGTRSPAWAKYKAVATVDAWLTGESKPGQGRRADTVGSVQIALTAPDGSPFLIGYVAVKPRDAVAWTDPDTGGLRPGLAGTVIEIIANGVTADGQLVNPRIDRVRDDKTPAWCEAGQLKALRASDADRLELAA
jgi:bifunctional non-homologous end joining protein LigD